MNKAIIRVLLGSSALFWATTAMAQDPAPADDTAQPDQSDATADAAISEAAPVDDAQARIELLQAQVEALQEALEGVKASMVKTTPSWKGAPQFEDKEAGWSFKVRGRLQYDVGYVSNPDDAIVTRNLGFNTRARRIRLGAEGTVPGGIGYKCEADFANASVGFGDCLLSYTPTNSQFNVAIGNQETNNGLEQISSSRWSSFIERAAFDDAFINTRRLGLNLGYVSKAGDIRLNAGLWTAHSIDSSLDNDGWIGAGRAVYAPLMGANQLHFGLNYQHREFQSNNTGTNNGQASGEPSSNQRARYRARPFSQLTDQRFVNTDFFAAKSDDIIGVEAAGIFKSLHVAAEGQYVKTNAYTADCTGTPRVCTGPTVTFNPATEDPVDQLDLFSNTWIPLGNPSFWGGYIEAGYYLTGETRGYKAGAWDRTKVLKPFSKGGMGAFQINGRVDYLDLDSSKLKNGCTNNFTTGLCTGSPNLSKGGKQLGFLAGVTWIPEDYMRVLLNYSHAKITGGPSATAVEPNEVPADPNQDPIDERSYGVDVVQARFQVDF